MQCATSASALQGNGVWCNKNIHLQFKGFLGISKQMLAALRHLIRDMSLWRIPFHRAMASMGMRERAGPRLREYCLLTPSGRGGEFRQPTAHSSAHLSLYRIRKSDWTWSNVFLALAALFCVLAAQFLDPHSGDSAIGRAYPTRPRTRTRQLLRNTMHKCTLV